MGVAEAGSETVELEVGRTGSTLEEGTTTTEVVTSVTLEGTCGSVSGVSCVLWTRESPTWGLVTVTVVVVKMVVVTQAVVVSLATTLKSC